MACVCVCVALVKRDICFCSFVMHADSGDGGDERRLFISASLAKSLDVRFLFCYFNERSLNQIW